MTIEAHRPGNYRFEKYQGLGNDFLVLIDVDGDRPVGGEAARALCDRRLGIGADGLIRVSVAAGPADYSMELYNADGGRAEMSGNGMRCVALALADAGVEARPTFTVATDAGLRQVRLLGGGRVEVDMGAAKPGDVQSTSAGRREMAVDMGNPHVVVEVDDPAAVDLVAEASDRAGANVEIVAAGPGPGELTMRVHERGVGETMACGTGACAAAFAAREWGLVGDRVTVHQPGGAAEVDLSGATITLTGPAVHVGSVEVSPSWR